MIVEITNHTPRRKTVAMINCMAEEQAFYNDVESIIWDWSGSDRVSLEELAYCQSAMLSELALTYRIPNRLTEAPLRRLKGGKK